MRPKPTNMGHPMFMFQADLPMGWHIPNLKPLGLSNSPTAIMTADVPKMWLSHQHHQLFRTASDEAGDSLADSAGEGSCASSQLFHAVSKTTFTTLTSFFLWITIQIYIYIYTYRWFTCGLHQKICRAFLYSSTLHMFAWPWQLPSYPTSVALGLSGSHLVRLDLHFTKWLKGCICDLQNVHR